MKIIFLRRNPVDQIRSHARMAPAKERRRAVEAVPSDEFRALLDHPRSIDFDDLDIISRWSKG